MRRTTISSIAVLVLLAAFAVWLQFGERRREPPSCINEQVLLDYWKRQGLIGEIRPEGGDLVARIDEQGWITLPRALQVMIGKAVYCPLIREGKGGIARIEGSDGTEIARVKNGTWSSARFPE